MASFLDPLQAEPGGVLSRLGTWANVVIIAAIFLVFVIQLRHLLDLRVRAFWLWRARKRIAKWSRSRGATEPIAVPDPGEICERDFFVKPWRAFRRDWNRFPPIDSMSGSLVSVRQYLDPVQLAGGGPRLRSISVVPGALLTLGIFGTFLGLTLGIGDIDLRGQTDANLFASVVALVQGLKTAFYTSLAGVFGALAFLGFEKRGVRVVLRNAERLIATAEAIFPSCEDGEYFHRSLDAQESVAQAMKTLSQDLALSLGDVYSRTFQEQLAPMIADVKTMVEKVAENTARAQAEGVERIVDKFLESMNSSLGDQFATLADSMSTINGDFVGLAEKLQASAENQLAVAEQSQAAVRVIAEHLPTIMAFTERMEAAAEQMAQSLAKVDALRTSLAEGVDATTEASKQIVAEIRTSTAALAESAIGLQKASETIASSQSVLQTTFERALGDFNDHVRKGLVDVLESFDGTLSEILQRFAGSIAQSNESLVHLERYATDLKSGVEAQVQGLQELLGSLNRTSQELSQSWTSAQESLRGTGNEISAAGRALVSAVEALPGKTEAITRSLVGPLDERESLLREIAAGTAREAAQLSDRTQQMSNMLGEALSKVQKTASQNGDSSAPMITVLQKIESGVAELRRTVDSAQSQIESTLVNHSDSHKPAQDGSRLSRLFGRGR